jgi:predicted DNA-binding helix-hairpin-helix protein
MVSIHKSLSTTDKLDILARGSHYDLACACGMNAEDQRHRSRDGTWIYPVAVPDRNTPTYLFKTLLSNVCANDCRYCPFRAGQDPRRCTLTPEEVVDTFFEYYRADRVQGLFLSSGVIGTPDQTMERLNQTVAGLRRREFRGYVHLKVIPGASDAAVEEAVSLASAVSVNIEAPGEQAFRQLCSEKDYLDDVIRPMKLISRLTGPGARYRRVTQTTQFVVGAADESDRQIVTYTSGLYRRLRLSRVYFTAYQRGLGDPDLPGERAPQTNADLLAREHRLYQVDFLLRKYGFRAEEIPFESEGRLSLAVDPKEVWADRHPACFPVDVNRASRHELLRVPGLGLVTVDRILGLRKDQQVIRRLEDIGRPNKRLRKAGKYLRFS